MEPKEFNSLGHELCKRKTPAAYRTAVSRAYYYAHNAIARFVRRYHDVPHNAEAHGLLIRLLKNSGDADLKDVATSLNDLREYRNEADYEMDAVRAEKTDHAQFCLIAAQDAVEGLVAVIGDHARWELVVKEIKRTEQIIASGRAKPP